MQYNKLIIYTDGGARGNPGPAGIGVVFYDENKNKIAEISKYIGIATNNQAEYKAVIIAFDNSHNIMDANNGVMELIISYTQPVNPDAIGTFNPFIFINGERGREVHLADFAPTSLADPSLIGSGDDASNVASASYYKNDNNMPWAINILYDFTVPAEKSPINKGYIKFVDWAISNGTEFDDWYSDVDDYRDYTYLIAD